MTPVTMPSMMPPDMQAPGGPAPQPPQAPPDAGNPKLEAAAKKAMSALAELYMVCHQIAPDSPECKAVHAMQAAVSEIATKGLHDVGGPPVDQSPMGQAAAGVHRAMAGPPQRGKAYA